ncbi:NAD(P)H-quinone oxidoreductase [Shewanella dokdonensis]|uniref:NAD(P)H-quinone oxidoreductase n=1 Tax=Shewanella dokdonensis TaxID=712036 RepID=A0ABX8DBF0_9GAMM|nr:NAD(P)H-quinone oxidoreductase [Shewanella dokdonensis]MCL1075450.1 NAD(P)H-quinone oxidoreductase [Shewanella dokdonensis]QVK22135.1 NAD(P)H-quinone oxidoreductase [Shewanella dokdonensis]
MRQVQFDNPGEPSVLHVADAPVPQPMTGQVLIKVAAAGVNGPDLFQRQGIYPPPPEASPILGLEVAGEIVAVAENETRWQVGDYVCALVPGGGYSEYVLTWAGHCLPLPQGWSMTEAAALPETLFTVWGNLFMRGGLKRGETVLLHGGSGGIGSTAIMLAKAFGCRVIATSGTEEKRDYCLALGADAAFDYHNGAFVEPALAFTEGRGVDVVLDITGGKTINADLKVLALDGRLLSIATREGRMAEVDVALLMFKRILWTGSTLRPQSVAAKAEIAAQLRQMVWPLLERGQLKPTLHKILPLEQAAAAHQLLESGMHMGKVVLTL